MLCSDFSIKHGESWIMKEMYFNFESLLIFGAYKQFCGYVLTTQYFQQPLLTSYSQ